MQRRKLIRHKNGSAAVISHGLSRIDYNFSGVTSPCTFLHFLTCLLSAQTSFPEIGAPHVGPLTLPSIWETDLTRQTDVRLLGKTFSLPFRLEKGRSS